VGGLCCGTLAQPDKTIPKTRNPKHWRAMASVPRSFMLCQVVEGRPSLLEVCISAVRPDAFYQIRVDIVCRNRGSICAEICICIHDSG